MILEKNDKDIIPEILGTLRNSGTIKFEGYWKFRSHDESEISYSFLTEMEKRILVNYEIISESKKLYKVSTSYQSEDKWYHLSSNVHMYIFSVMGSIHNRLMEKGWKNIL